MPDDPTPDPEAQGKPVGRRIFLGLLGLGAVGVATGSAIQGWLEDNLSPIIGRDPTGVLGLLPIGRFRIYTVTGGLPDRSRAEYRLRVKGLVDRPLDLSFADLAAMPKTNVTRDFQCVTGWRVPDVKWGGVRLRDVLDRAGVGAEATAVRFVSFDGEYTESLTLDAGAPRRRARRVRVRGWPAVERARRPGAALRRTDVRVQVVQVAERDRAHEGRRPRVLGGARIRRRRMGRALQRPRRPGDVSERPWR